MYKKLYPALKPFAAEWFNTGDGHQVYVEQAGNQHGVPVIFLHGGPGSSCKDHHRCFFNPEKYHIILMDQRGAGRSRPLAKLENNTTDKLIGDMEMIRQALGIDKWLLFGGSWGATLALLYAQANTDKVLGLIIRGAFLARDSDANWFLRDGVNRLFPEAWQRFEQAIPKEEQSNLVQAYHFRLVSDDPLVRQEAAREWNMWGGAVVLGEQFNADELGGEVPEASIAQASIETHYALNNYFMDDNQILNNTLCLSTVPLTIIHGRLDYMCPIESSYSLSQRLPHAQFITLPNSTHLAQGDEMIDALVSAADAFSAKFLVELKE